MTNLSDYTVLTVWRIIEVMCHWAGCWNATQVASLVMLSLAPPQHYMHTFQPTHSPLFPTLAALAAGDVLSFYLPFQFFCPSPPNPNPTPSKKKNRVFDSRLSTTLLTSTIYQLVLYIASKNPLVDWLTSSGWELESVVHVNGAYASDARVLLVRAAMMIPIGWAASEIIYSPNGVDSTVTTYPATEKKEGTGQREAGAHFFRLWIKPLSSRSRDIVKRTLLVAAYQSVSVTVSLAGTVKGSDLRGMVGISGAWAVATVIVGGVLWQAGKSYISWNQDIGYCVSAE